MLTGYLPIAVLFAFGLVLGAVFIVLSKLLGKDRIYDTKLAPYECGLDQASSPYRRYSIHFFLVAMLFLIFDVEVTFLFPWAILLQSFKEAGLGLFIFIEGTVFLFILALGLAYVWKRGALDWQRN